QVVQPALTGGPDVHAGSLANRLQALQHGDRARVVVVLLGCHGPGVSSAPQDDSPTAYSTGPPTRNGVKDTPSSLPDARNQICTTRDSCGRPRTPHFQPYVSLGPRPGTCRVPYRQLGAAGP